MKDLATLFSSQKYDEIIKETKDKIDGESLYYRASSLLAIGKKEEAMDVFVKHRKTLFAYNPLATIKSDLKLRALLEQFDEAYDDLYEFEEYPYVSQNVEELLRSARKYIREKEKEGLSKKPLSVIEAKKRLSSPKSDFEALSVLEAISEVPVDPFLEEIKALLVSKANDSVKTYAFLLLVNCGYDEEISMIKGDRDYHLIPKNVNPPFVGPLYKEVKERISDLSKDPSVNSVAYSLWSDYVLALFPSSPFDKETPKTYAEVFYAIALSYLCRPDASSLLKERSIKEEDLASLEKDISLALSSFPPIGE